MIGLPDLSSYAGSGRHHGDRGQATGTGSQLSLSKLGTMTEDTGSYSSRTQIQALSGGDVELPALTSISGGPVQLESDGAGSTLNINALASLTGNTGQQLFLRPPGHQSRHRSATSALATLKEANLTLDGTGTLSTSQIATFTGGTLSLSGGTASFSGLTDADGSSLEASGGGKLTVSTLTSYAGGVTYTSLLEATGTGSLLSLPALTKMTEDTSSYSSRTQVQALSGGDVELPALTSISGGPVQLESDGAGSTLNINALASLTGNTGQQYFSGLQVTNHGTASTSALATLKEANLTLDGTGTLSTSQITTFTGGTLSLSGGTASFSGLTDADGSSLEASGGGKLTVSTLASYAGGVTYTSVLQATGTGSLLSLPALTKMTEDTGNYSSRTQVQALSGGDVELPALTSISGGPVQLESDGAGSTLNINALTSLTGNAGQQFFSGLQVTNHGTASDQRPGHAQGGEPDARRHRHAFHQPDHDVHRRDAQPERRHGELQRTYRRRRLELRGQRWQQADALGARELRRRRDLHEPPRGDRHRQSPLPAGAREDDRGHRQLLFADAGPGAFRRRRRAACAHVDQWRAGAARERRRRQHAQHQCARQFDGQQRSAVLLRPPGHESRGTVSDQRPGHAQRGEPDARRHRYAFHQPDHDIHQRDASPERRHGELQRTHRRRRLEPRGQRWRQADALGARRATPAASISRASSRRPATGSLLSLPALTKMTEDTERATSRGHRSRPFPAAMSSCLLSPRSAAGRCSSRATAPAARSTSMPWPDSRAIPGQALRLRPPGDESRGSVSDNALTTLKQDESDTRRHRHAFDQPDHDVHRRDAQPERRHGELQRTYRRRWLEPGGQRRGQAHALVARRATPAASIITSTLEATGTGSLLSLPALAKITEDTSNYASRTQVQALAGGDVELPALTSISGGPVQLESDGAGSTLNINALATIHGQHRARPTSPASR